MTQNEQPTPKSGKVYIRTRPLRLPQHTRQGRNGSNGTSKGRPSQGMDPPEECLRSLQIPRLHRLLPLLHTRLLADRPTPTRSNKTGNGMALGRQGAESIRRAERQNGQQTHPTTTQLQQN